MYIYYYSNDEIPEIKMSGKSVINKDGNKVTLEVQESDSSYRYRSLMGKPQLVLRFSLPAFVEIPVGAWCEFMGQKFTLNDPENIRKNGTRNIEYTITMGTDEDRMGLFKMRNVVDGRLKYSMCATPKEFIQEIVANMNQRDGGGWSVGTCIESTAKTVEFNHSYIDEALQAVAETFETEWEIANKSISLRKVEYFKDNPLPLSYGKGKGFIPGVGRTSQSDEKPIKRLYVQGGDRNIDPATYGSKELLLPKNQTLDYEGRKYGSDSDGLYIERIDKISDAVKEDSIELSEIYPSRIGTVSEVVTVDMGKNFYDIVDSSIPANLDYEKYLIAGETMTIIFQSGMLAGDGKQFEVKYYHEAVEEKQGTQTIKKAARRFEIVPQEIDGQTMPNETFKPKAGDTYAVFGCALPDEYICDDESKTGASWDLFREAVRHLYEHEDQKFTFTGTLQGLYAKKNWENIGGRIKVGAYILFSDEQFAKDGVAIRITGIKEMLTSPYTPTIEISNSVSGISATQSKINQVDAIGVELDDMRKNILSFTKRRFRDAQETIEMLNGLLDAGFDNFTNGINPITVSTMAMLVGDESLQFRFVNRKTAPITEVPSYVTYNQETKTMTIPQTILQHLTLGIDTVKASHEPNEYHFWDVAAFTSAYLDDAKKKYYLYVRANRNDSNAVFMLQEQAHKMDGDATYYWFLVGILNSEYEGERSFASLYGFTEVLPGRITTNRIVSPDGNTYFDLVAGEIGGNIKIRAGSSGLKNLSEYSEIESAFNDIGTELNVLGDGISAHSTRLNEIDNTILSSGWITKAEGNTWWAGKELEDGNKIISYINQTATTTTISSSRVNLIGAVTYSMFDQSMKRSIDSISDKVDEDDLGTLAWKNNIAWDNLVSGLQSIIEEKAVKGEITRNDLSSSLRNTLSQYLMESDLPDYLFDYDSITDAILGEQTLIVGGFLNTSYAMINKIAAVEGTIAGFNIKEQSIVSVSNAFDGGTNASKLNGTEFHLHAKGNGNAYLGYSGNNVRAEIGLNTYNGSSSQKIMCDLRDTEASAYTYTKIGLYIDIYDTYNAQELEYNSSITTNIGATAIYINRGHVTGLKRRLRHISGSSTTYLNKDDSIVNMHNTNACDVYLPTGCEDGQEIWICPWNTITVKTQGSDTIRTGDTNDKTSETCSKRRYNIFIYGAYAHAWRYGYLEVG